ncbi:D-alanyl-D-alanine carboxypeptidase [Ascidiimonas sp. W6]|uniref:D-alanyl-D-alanine carboxypeptidase n=1 Tax=Ascidiimonas meishanensis TaxID=3128903 RepID=UPI0030EDE037
MCLQSIGVKAVTAIIIIWLCAACGTQNRFTSEMIKVSEKEHFITGFMLYDPDKKDTLISINHNKYLNPASNTKIFTLYSAMKMIGDSIPAIKWKEQNDTLFLMGTGDPTLLHPWFNSMRVIELINTSSTKKVVLDTGNYLEDKYGPGWAWEDYAYYFMPERNSFPMYGNVVNLALSRDAIQVVPDIFAPQIKKEKQPYSRSLNKNTFYITSNKIDSLEVPYITNDSLTMGLLNKHLSKELVLGKFPPSQLSSKIHYSIKADSLYKRMMSVSDNFLAEQMMILCSGTISDTLSVKKAIDYSLKNYFSDIPQYPRWVDGSGLSRYNLFSPHSFVYVLNKMYQEFDKERLLNLFPAINLLGETDNDLNLYLYAKPGSFSNNYCLSGYLITKSGKTLIFSFMANHFTIPSKEIKRQLQTILLEIRNQY